MLYALRLVLACDTDVCTDVDVMCNSNDKPLD